MAKKIKKAEQKDLLDVIIEGMQELKAKNIVVMLFFGRFGRIN